MRGEVYEINNPNARGHERRGKRYAVVVQAHQFLNMSTWAVCPTSTSARPASYRPEVEILDAKTRVLVEQITAVDPQRLGKQVGYLSHNEMRAVDQAMRDILGL